MGYSKQPCKTEAASWEGARRRHLNADSTRPFGKKGSDLFGAFFYGFGVLLKGGAQQQAIAVQLAGG